MITSTSTIKPVLYLSSVLALFEVTPVSPDWINTAEHLTLTGALLFAVSVLWRALVAKDEQLVQSTKTVTEALQAASTSNVELRRIIEASVQAKEALAASIDSLHKAVDEMNTVQRVLHK